MDKDDIKPGHLDKLMKLFYNEKNRAFEHLHNSFTQHVRECVLKEPELNDNIIFESELDGKRYTYKFEMTNIRLEAPHDKFNNDKNAILFPQDARRKLKSYISNLICDVKQVQRIETIVSGHIENKINYEEKNVHVASIPIMVKSPYCNTQIRKDVQNNECIYNPGGNFIVKGASKIVIPQEGDITNKTIIKTKKEKTGKDKITIYEAQVYSKRSDNIRTPAQLIKVRMTKENVMLFSIKDVLDDIPVCIILKALGLTTDKEINLHITQSNDDISMSELLKYSIFNYMEEKWFHFLDVEKKEELVGVVTKDDAINYLVKKINIGRLNSTDIETLFLEKKTRLLRVLNTNLFPHITGTLNEKARFLCLMCNKLMNCYLNRLEPDNRDAAINKRVINVGVLLDQIFRPAWKKMITDCYKNFKKTNNSHENPINGISKINPSIVEQAMISNLSSGTWGTSKSTGVAQTDQNLTYLQILSARKRFASSKSSSTGASKISDVRLPDGQYYGFYDIMETPEHGENVGLVKHLCLPATISINSLNQPEIIKEILHKEMQDDKIQITNINSLNPLRYGIDTKIFINGEWFGMTTTPVELTKKLKKLRTKGDIEKVVTISHNYNTKEINIYTESGRLLRPILKVRDNQLVLKQYMLDMIDIDSNNPLKIHTWEDFLSRFSDAIDIVDPEEQSTLLIAHFPSELKEQHEKQNRIIENPNIMGDTYNRYNDTVYKRYTHCEIDPCNSFGVVLSNTTLPEMSDSVRNYFAFSQIKQGIGIPFDDILHLIELSYYSYNPEKPIVYPKTAEYTNTLNMPFGQNTVVAICMYTGYNQEDSIVAKRSSVERGMHCCETQKKEISEISKDENTTKNDQFMKPDSNLVEIRKERNYNKLNSKGFAPIETKLVNNDVIIGKVRPMSSNNTGNKSLGKDVSSVYVSTVPGVVNNVFYNIKRHDGVHTTVMGIRQVRKPVSGDKFCSRNGQKGTIGTILNDEDMPFTKEGIKPDLIINSCCIPSRRTVSQIVESFIGKYAAIKGGCIRVDSFRKIDLEPIIKELGKFQQVLKETKIGDEDFVNMYSYGCEKMYCGRTGEVLGAVFLGPVYYLRLKHLVNEKLHSRARGTVTVATRQPPEGRQKGGGAKLGEMERDCFIAYGASMSLKEKHMELSDGDVVHICTNCGLLATKERNRDVYHCKSCEKLKPNVFTYTVKVALPYACKILFMSLLAIGIVPRIRVKDDEFSISV